LPPWEIALALDVLIGITSTMGNRSGPGRSHWHYERSSYSAKEDAIFHHRLVLVSWDACTGNRVGASRMARACRSLHVFATDWALHRWVLGPCRLVCILAPPAHGSGRCRAIRNRRVKLRRLDPSVLLA